MCWEDICEEANDRVPKMKFEGGGGKCAVRIFRKEKNNPAEGAKFTGRIFVREHSD